MARLIFPNYATDPVIHAWAEDHLPILVKDARKAKSGIEQRWMHFRKMLQTELDSPSYLGRNQVYIPAFKRAVDTWVTATMDALYPVSTDWFRTDARKDIGSPEQVPRWQALQRAYLDEMGLLEEMPIFLRDFYGLGTGIFRDVWDIQEELQRVWERQLIAAPLDTDAEERRIREEPDLDQDVDLERAGTVFRLVEKLIQTHCGPSGRVVDPFHFFLAPLNARSIREATLAFEDLEVTMQHIEDRHEQWMDPDNAKWGRVYDHPDWAQIIAAGGILTDDMLRSESERFERLGIDPNTNRAFATLSKKGNAQLSEAFWRGEIKSREGTPAVDETGKRFGVRDWHFVLFNEAFVIRAHPNLHYDNARPWIDARMYKTTGCFFPPGVGDAVASLQLVVNDTMNLTMDNIVMALSPPVVIDQTEMLFPEQLEWAPGAFWYGKPDAVKPLTLPTQAQLGMTMVNMISGLVQDGAGANFAVQATPPNRGRGRAAQTAGGMAQMQAQGSQEMLAFARSIERQFLEPMLGRHYQFTAQFGCDKRTIQRLGADGVSLILEEVGVEDILGEYAYSWRGATAVKEQAMLLGALQQLPQMVQLLASFDPTIAQTFDAQAFLKKYLKNGANVPWADELFRTPAGDVSVDPKLEHDALNAHRRMQPHPSDDDARHLAMHDQALAMDDRFLRDPIARQMLMEHRAATLQQMAAKAQAQMQAMMQQMMAGQQQNGDGAPGQAPMAAPVAAEPTPGAGSDPADAMRAMAAGGM